MDNRYKEMDDLSKQLYSTIETLTNKVKDNARKNSILSDRFDDINRSLKDHLTYVVDIQSYSKKIASNLNKCSKDSNEELVKIKEQELNFLAKRKGIKLIQDAAKSLGSTYNKNQ